MNRRDVLARMTASAGVGLATLMGLPALAQRPKLSRLVIVGGAEDRLQDRIILRKYVDYCGGSAAKIRIITAASGDPEGVWQSYRNVFMALGVEDVQRLVLDDRNSAHSPQVQPEILQADGIFMSGGDQSRLMDILWDTPAYQSMHQAFHVNGCCIGGTSAGAAVMSRHMIAQGLPCCDRAKKRWTPTSAWAFCRRRWSISIFPSAGAWRVCCPPWRCARICWGSVSTKTPLW